MKEPTDRFMNMLRKQPGEPGQVLKSDKDGWFPKFVDVEMSDPPKIEMYINPNEFKEYKK